PVAPVPANQEDEGETRGDARESATVPADVVIDTDYFAAGKRVDISGLVKGDVYAAGGQVLVDGTINGDLLAFGGLVTISGTIGQDARLLSGQTTIDGEIGGNITVAGGTIEVSTAAVIGGGLVAAGGNLRVAAPVGGDVKIAGGNVTISDRIDGNVDAAVGALRLTSKAAVGGNLTYWSKTAASMDEHAQIAGTVTRRSFPEELTPSAAWIVGAWAGFKLLLTLTSFVSTLILGLLFIRFYPNATQRAVSHLRERPLASLGLGFLALTLTPIAVAVLAATLVGIPLAVVLFAWFLITLYLGRIFVIHAVGLFVFRWVGKEAYERWAFIAALVLYSLLSLIPLLGDLIVSFAVLFGLGMTLLMNKEVYLAARNQAMI
ncbi:MAG: hypothetical protein ACE5MM_10550, partial [Nitrospiraceae bacterium]